MHFVYILYSLKKDKFYIGQTEDIEKRLSQHIIRKNLGADDWIIKYIEEFNTRSEAVQRESEIKSKKRRKYIEQLVQLGKYSPSSTRPFSPSTKSAYNK